MHTNLQRLYITPDGKLEYDSMGYGKYEFGATTIARLLLAQAFGINKGDIESFSMKMIIKNQLKTVCVFASKSQVLKFIEKVSNKDNLNKFIEDAKNDKLRNKGALVSYGYNTIGWLNVYDALPPMIIMDMEFDEAKPLVDSFLQDFINNTINNGSTLYPEDGIKMSIQSNWKNLQITKKYIQY